MTTPLFAAAFLPLLAASEGIPSNVLPVIIGGMVLGGLGLGIALAAILTDARTERARQENIRLALEKGTAVPLELVAGKDRPNRPRDDRRAGIILVALSPGLFIFLRMLGLGGIAYVAAITACVGVALLLNSFLERNQDRAETNGHPPA